VGHYFEGCSFAARRVMVFVIAAVAFIHVSVFASTAAQAAKRKPVGPVRLETPSDTGVVKVLLRPHQLRKPVQVEAVHFLLPKGTQRCKITVAYPRSRPLDDEIVVVAYIRAAAIDRGMDCAAAECWKIAAVARRGQEPTVDVHLPGTSSEVVLTSWLDPHKYRPDAPEASSLVDLGSVCRVRFQSGAALLVTTIPE
jgi:hypothetical protein